MTFSWIVRLTGVRSAMRKLCAKIAHDATGKLKKYFGLFCLVNYAHVARMAKQLNRVATNLTLPTIVKNRSEHWAEANGQTLSGLVEDLLRAHLRERGIDCEVPLAELMRQLDEASREKKQSGLKKIKGTGSD